MCAHFKNISCGFQSDVVAESWLIYFAKTRFSPPNFMAIAIALWHTKYAFCLFFFGKIAKIFVSQPTTAANQQNKRVELMQQSTKKHTLSPKEYAENVKFVALLYNCFECIFWRMICTYKYMVAFINAKHCNRIFPRANRTTLRCNRKSSISSLTSECNGMMWHAQHAATFRSPSR